MNKEYTVLTFNIFLSFITTFIFVNPLAAQNFELNDRDYFEAPGANVLVFSNWYDGNFSDSKMSGIEIFIMKCEQEPTGMYVCITPRDNGMPFLHL